MTETTATPSPTDEAEETPPEPTLEELVEEYRQLVAERETRHAAGVAEQRARALARWGDRFAAHVASAEQAAQVLVRRILDDERVLPEAIEAASPRSKGELERLDRDVRQRIESMPPAAFLCPSEVPVPPHMRDVEREVARLAGDLVPRESAKRLEAGTASEDPARLGLDSPTAVLELARAVESEGVEVAPGVRVTAREVAIDDRHHLSRS